MIESSIAIVGAGLMGRTLAIDLSRRGFPVNLFDRDDKDGLSSCASTGAGMLAPICEFETCDELVFKLGVNSFERRSDLLSGFRNQVFRQKAGILVVGHPLHSNLLIEFRRRIIAKFTDARLPLSSSVMELGEDEIAQYESDLNSRCA